MNRAWLFITLGVALAPTVARAEYSFSIAKMRMTNVVQPDASVVIEYEIQFVNSPWGQAIDVVDVGLPHGDYDFATMEASIDGEPVDRIGDSSYIDTGVEVHLGLHAIGSGERGTFRFRAQMPNMVYNDTTSDELASFQITPTWFDSSLLEGSSELEIAVQMPPGVDPTAVVWHDVPFDRQAGYNDTALVGWTWPSTRLDGPHRVGVSFPIASMDRVVHITKLELLERWFEASIPVRIGSALIAFVIFAIFFFRWSDYTGFSVFLFVIAGASVAYFLSSNVQLYTLPLWLVLAGIMEWRLQRKRRVYLPPIVQVEGGGIKRGLTAPEAAVLLELPLGKVLTLVIFGMLKKGLLRQVGADPLRVEVDRSFAGKDKAERRAAAAEKGVVIHRYENEFIDTLTLSAPHFAITEIDFSSPMRDLVEHVAERMIGFDLSDTQDYYRTIVTRAWEMAKGLGEVEQRQKHVDKNLEWLLLDDDWSDRFEGWGRSGYHYHPIWIRTGPTYGGTGASLPAGLGGAAASGGGGGSAPTFGDVAGSFAGWTENVTGQLASVISPTTLAADAGVGKGVVNLSGADRVTGDVLGAFFSGGGGGGGGGSGGGCACACAGCACACACAGGGR